ncbi:MAG: hypothetical protein IJX98_04965 [Clostridia bacterium]|nr:hypothetical protein [Clostridia bacterium]
MKKFLFAVFPLFYFILLCVFPLAVNEKSAASAEGESYACILEDDVYFYSAESESSGLFVLPKTYYVKILLVAQPFTKVEYLTDGANTQRLVGYCKTDKLTFVDYTPQIPYLYYLFEVTYTAENSAAEDDFLNKITVTCTYYGDYYIGSKTYAYVLQNGSFGYVPKPDGFSYPKSAEHENKTQISDGDSPQEEPASGGNGAQIAILIVLCLLVPILAALVVRSSKKQPYDFEES